MFKKGKFQEKSIAYGMGITCKYMYEHLYIVFLLPTKFHEIMLFNRSSTDKLYITCTFINTNHSSNWKESNKNLMNKIPCKQAHLQIVFILPRNFHEILSSGQRETALENNQVKYSINSKNSMFNRTKFLGVKIPNFLQKCISTHCILTLLPIYILVYEIPSRV